MEFVSSGILTMCSINTKRKPWLLTQRGADPCNSTRACHVYLTVGEEDTLLVNMQMGTSPSTTASLYLSETPQTSLDDFPIHLEAVGWQLDNPYITRTVCVELIHRSTQRHGNRSKTSHTTFSLP